MLLIVRPMGFALISQYSQETMILIKQNWNHEKRMVKILIAKNNPNHFTPISNINLVPKPKTFFGFRLRELQY